MVNIKRTKLTNNVGKLLIFKREFIIILDQINN